MTSPKGDRFPASEVSLRLPVFACEYLIMTDLSAAQWRLALALVSLAHQADGVMTIEKPKLEVITGVKLTTVVKLLSPLMYTCIDLPGHHLHREPVFERIEYDGGKKGKAVGQIRATLSIAMSQFLAQGANHSVSVDADELREYRSVSAIILRLRFAATFVSMRTASRAKLSITAADLSAIFGSYARAALIKRASATTGEIAEYMALSRAGAVLVEPAVAEINAASKFLRLKAAVTMEGRTWARIDIVATKLTARVIAPKPVTRKILGLRGRPTRAVVKNAIA